MKNLTVIFPYFMNQGMLAKQIEVFNSYSKDARKKLQLIVVDDCSPIGERAEEAIGKLGLKAEGYDFRLYRVLSKIRWNWLQCRNLGAKEATNGWLLLTDIDHIILPKTMEKLISTEYDTRYFYTFPRVNWVDNSEYKPHPNSYLMTQKLYWKVGGYDETYSGHYGTDGMWRRRCEEHAEHAFLTGLPLARVDRADIPDASTKPEVMDRKANRGPHDLDEIRAFKKEHNIGIQTLRLPWKRII
jgi:hypothetical protein